MRFFTTSSISNNLSFTPEGFLVCANVPIARTGDQIYYDGEVPITPDQNGAITITREPTEVFDAAAMSSFEGKPVTMTHPDDTVTPETQEEVPVTFSLPNHAVLNTPNAISAKDFENWTQERSTYQSDNFDAHFEAPLTMNDKGEAPSNGSLLIAPYGKGNMVYVSLVLFRQLPAGNPGAYKLLANIISLAKH